MANLLWKPSANAITNSNMQKFIQHINAQHQLDINGYPALYQWSIDYPEQFWAAVWQFTQIKASQSWQEVLVDAHKMPGAKWFTGAKLNFAENLLWHSSNKTALIACNENQQRREISYQQLREEVASFAYALKAMGVGVNDRVVGFLPNIPETIIAMLATTSLGAIWSSCSPDFGTAGIYDRFGQIEPKVLITTDGYQYGGKYFNSLDKIAELQQKIPSLQKIVVIPYVQASPNIDHIPQAVMYADFTAKKTTKLTFAQLPFDHPIYILYSSGTTGVPKCIVHSAGGTLIQHLKELILHTDLKADDTICYYTTCGWMMWNWLVSSLATGATLILYDGSPFHPNPQAMFDLIDREKITIFGTSAKFISAAEKANVIPMQTHQLTSLRTILSTGSPLLSMNFAYVYNQVKADVCLSSISGGTDIVSCFALGNPLLPVYEGELQCRGLGLKVEIFDETGHAIKQQKGELVCTAPFPAMPIYFWQDTNNQKYHNAYFARFSNVWAHGDYAEITEHDGVIIYGRSDAVLNPGGIRIGTAEIYRQVENINEVIESLAIEQEYDANSRLILFVKLKDNYQLTEDLKQKIKTMIRQNASPHHVPAKIIQVADIPRTISGKIVELAVRDVVHGRPIKNMDALANPQALEYFKNIKELSE